MGRGKLELKKIDNKLKRQVTFSKRRKGIMKKAQELSVLCDAKVSLLIISSTNKLRHFLSPGLSLKKMFDEYQKIEGVDLWLKHSERMQEEQRKLLELNNKLRTEISQRMGGDLEGLTLLQLRGLQQEMEEAITKIRNQQSSEAVIPAKNPQHEKETSNQTGMWQQSSFVHAQKSVIPDPEGFDKFHSSGQLDLPVESLNHNLPAASSPTTSISATAGSGGTKDADDTTSRRGNDLASEDLNSVHGDISGNCVLGSGLQGSDSFNLTEIAGNMCKGLDEVNSFRSEATLVSVRGYKVKPKYESLLGYILSKYGDIGANCSLGTVKFRSLYIDAICEIIQKLKDTNIVAITEDDLREMMGCVVDVEKANIDIGWLKERLNEIREAKQAVQFLRSSSIDKNRHAELKAQVKKRNQQLEEYKRELADKEVVLRNLEKEIFDTEREIVAMEDGVAEVEKVILEKQAKVRHFMELGALGQGLI